MRYRTFLAQAIGICSTPCDRHGRRLIDGGADRSRGVDEKRLAILTANAFGDTQTMLGRYRSYRSAMEQIGVEPSPDMLALFRRLHPT